MQGEIEAALRRLTGDTVTTVGAGRTDAGVHALGQVALVEAAPDDFDLAQVRRALNRMCAPSIAFMGVREAPQGWDARFSALSRTYVYAVLEADVHDPWLSATALHHPAPLDIDAMNEASGHLAGLHDFTSFGRLSSPDASPRRTLFELRWMRTGSIVRVRARANAFIHQMVRSLVGTLLQVGEGRRSPDEMPGILAARDRAAAGPVAPPHGLCLVSVEYPDDWSRPFDPLE